MEENATIPQNAMIIEDEKDLSYLLASVLKQMNVESKCVYSIREAKENVHNVKPSFIFLDNHLPDGRGTDFIEQAKEIFPSAKIVMMTAHDSSHEINKAFQNGADYFISKPFNSSAIKIVIDLFKHGKIA